MKMNDSQQWSWGLSIHDCISIYRNWQVMAVSLSLSLSPPPSPQTQVPLLFYNRLKVKLSFFVSVQVTRIVLLWVNNHFNDFEGNPEMTQFLENFEKHLETSVSKHCCQCALQSSVLHTDLLSDFLLMPLKFALLSLSVRTCRQCTVKFSLRACKRLPV